MSAPLNRTRLAILIPISLGAAGCAGYFLLRVVGQMRHPETSPQSEWFYYAVYFAFGCAGGWLTVVLHKEWEDAGKPMIPIVPAMNILLAVFLLKFPVSDMPFFKNSLCISNMLAVPVLWVALTLATWFVSMCWAKIFESDFDTLWRRLSLCSYPLAIGGFASANSSAAELWTFFCISTALLLGGGCLLAEIFRRQKSRPWEMILFCGVLAVGVFTHFAEIRVCGLGWPDEAEYLNNGHALATLKPFTHFAKPLFVLSNALFYHLAGFNDYNPRYLSGAFAVFNLILCLGLGSVIFSRKWMAASAVFVIAVYPSILGVDRYGLAHTATASFVLLGAGMGLRCLSKKSQALDYFLLGLCCALTILTHPGSMVTVFSLCAAVFLMKLFLEWREGRPDFMGLALRAAIAGAVVLEGILCLEILTEILCRLRVETAYYIKYAFFHQSIAVNGVWNDHFFYLKNFFESGRFQLLANVALLFPLLSLAGKNRDRSRTALILLLFAVVAGTLAFWTAQSKYPGLARILYPINLPWVMFIFLLPDDVERLLPRGLKTIFAWTAAISAAAALAYFAPRIIPETMALVQQKSPIKEFATKMAGRGCSASTPFIFFPHGLESMLKTTGAAYNSDIYTTGEYPFKEYTEIYPNFDVPPNYSRLLVDYGKLLKALSKAKYLAFVNMCDMDMYRPYYAEMERLTKMYGWKKLESVGYFDIYSVETFDYSSLDAAGEAERLEKIRRENFKNKVY